MSRPSKAGASGSERSGTRFLLACFVGIFAFGRCPSGISETNHPASVGGGVAIERFMQSPAVFIENRGQWADTAIRFALSSRGANVGLTDDTIRFQLFQRGDMTELASAGSPAAPTASVLEAGARPGPSRALGRLGMSQSETARRAPTRMREFSVSFPASRKAAPAGKTQSVQRFHYRSGPPERWREDVPAWEAAEYRGLYEGIDLRLTGRQAGLKYEFVVAPGADWRRILVRYDGIERLALRPDGALVLQPGHGWAPLVDGAPLVYQEMQGHRVQLEGQFVLVDDQTYRFSITGAFDPALTLIIDPDLLWSGYLGGSKGESGNGVAVDSRGNVLVTGSTSSSGWFSQGFDTNYHGAADAFLTKLSPAGAHLWSTFLGGTTNDSGAGVTVDRLDNVLVTGSTSSGGWVSGGFDTNHHGGSDAFVAKLSSDGAYLWSTYLGGTNDDYGRAVAVDRAGNVLVAGGTSSGGWGSGGFGPSYHGQSDGFVVKLSPDGGFEWSSYLGGQYEDRAEGIAADGEGNVVVTGYTSSANWVNGGFDPALHGAYDAFVAKLSPNGSHLWSTYLGGRTSNYGTGVAVGATGNIWVAGYTSSSGWVSGGYGTNFVGGLDGFLVKLSATGAHLWSTYIGGSSWDYGYAVALDGEDNGFVTGWTFSTNWVSGGFDTTFHGPSSAPGGDAFVVKVSSAGAHIWSSYLGGSGWELGSSVATDDTGHLLVTGTTGSSGWVGGGFDTTLDGTADAFVVKVRDRDAGTEVGALQVVLAPAEAVAAGAQWRQVGTLEWRASAEIENDLRAGQCRLEFKPLDGWEHPPEKVVIVVPHQTTIETATYARLTGSLRVTISPAEAISAGAQWRRLGTTIWRSSNETETGVTAGPWVVEFKEISGWTAGARQSVLITVGQTAQLTTIYVSPQTELAWSSYLGGSHADYGEAVAVDGDGNVLVAGTTDSSGWVSGGFDTSFDALSGTIADEAFVVKLSPQGDHLWSTYLGGEGADSANGVAVDHAGNVLVTGTTTSPGWASGGFNTDYQGGTFFFDGDAFLAKLSPGGAHLWSTYLGGADTDFGNAVAVDSQNNVVVTGNTRCGGWVSGGFDTNFHGIYWFDPFVVKVSPDGAHVWSTFLGGLQEDTGDGIAVDGADNVLVTGGTFSLSWVNGGFQTTHRGFQDAYVVKISSDGAHVWSTYLGGNSYEQGQSVAADGAGNVLVAGETDSTGWVSGGSQTNYAGGVRDAFVVKLNALGAHVWSTYLGGNGNDAIYGIAADQAGNSLVAGSTDSRQWVRGGFDTNFVCGPRVFVAKLSGTGQQMWSSYLGCEASAAGIALDAAENILVTGTTSAAGWVNDGYDVDQGGSDDGFVAKIQAVGTVREIGTLRVFIEPPGVLAAGARWRRHGTSIWRNSGETIEGLKVGDYLVEFNDVAGWDPPATQPVTVQGRQTNDVAAAYARQTGALQVAIEPSTAREGGARWRRVGASDWRPSGDTETLVPAGEQVVEFKGVPGWLAPAAQTVLIVKNLTTHFIGTYDVRLIPELSWSCYLGGSSFERGRSVAVDAAGNAFVVGQTWSDGWVSGGLDPAFNGGETDAFAAKLSPTGAHLWSTYLGGNDMEQAEGVTVDGAGNVLVVGWTTSTDWVLDGFSPRSAGGWKGFVVKLSPAGTHLWSTYVGGSGNDAARAIAADAQGNVLVTGWTHSNDWVRGGFNTNRSGFADDAFVVKLNTHGVPLWSTYLGGEYEDDGFGIGADKDGNVFVTGSTASTGWVSGGYKTNIDAGGPVIRGDGFVVKLSPSGAHLWSTYLGGAFMDYAEGLAVDAMGDVLVVGTTFSDQWVRGGYNTNFNGGTLSGGQDGFVAKISSTGALLWSTYLGGRGDDQGHGIAAAADGSVVVTGETPSPGWVSGGFGTNFLGMNDIFLVRLSPLGAHLWSSYLGGTNRDCGYGVALAKTGEICVTGYTYSADWVPSGSDPQYHDFGDVFVAKVREMSAEHSLRVGAVAIEAAGIRLTVDAAGFPDSVIGIESTASLRNPIQWSTETNAIFSTNAAAQIEALLPAVGEAHYYRVRAMR